jgi:hypothetical protein
MPPNQRNIVWLASYPKSGNTWFRVFLTALCQEDIIDPDINELYETPIASSRQLFDEITGVFSADLQPSEIELLRPDVYRQNAMESDRVIYHKVHDTWSLLPDGQALFPSEVTKGVIYFIRDPRDVAVSFAHHLNVNFDRAIALMNNTNYAFCSRTDRLNGQLRQKLGSWSEHVKSWVDRSGLPILVLRFEDMKSLPLPTFTRAVKFLDLEYPQSAIEKAIELSSFDRLQKQEVKHGFRERSHAASSFFRKGIIGDWRNNLAPDQVERIIKNHAETMRRYGYFPK